MMGEQLNKVNNDCPFGEKSKAKRRRVRRAVKMRAGNKEAKMGG